MSDMLALIVAISLVVSIVAAFHVLPIFLPTLQRLYCRIGWHSAPVGYDPPDNDGRHNDGKCRWCGRAGLIDSQGNLFNVEDVDHDNH